MAEKLYVYRVWFADGYGILSRGRDMSDAKARAIADMANRKSVQELRGDEKTKALTVVGANKVQ